MVSSHTSAAIAQTVFYAPIVPISFYVVIRNWNNRPRMAWFPFLMFSILRLVGGILVILQASDQSNIGLIITAIIFLNVGQIPLMVSTLGIIRLVINPVKDDKPHLGLAAKAVRISFLVAASLLIASGSILSQDNLAGTARALSKAGYVLFAAILITMMGFLAYLHRRKGDLIPRDLVYLHGAILGMPTLVVRTVYGLLYTFTSANLFSIWNPLFGSAVAFCLMALLPEYITLLIYIHLAFRRIRDGKAMFDQAGGVSGETIKVADGGGKGVKV